MTKQTINETAVGGAIGAGGVAVRMDAPKTAQSLKAYLKRVNKTNKHWKPVNPTPFPIRMNEAFDMQDVLSRLNGIESKATDTKSNTTYGIEDSDGSIMKVTVRKDQAAEFEAALAHELADIEAYSATGTDGKEISMAELLYRLKDKFDIIDVEFPKIPTDMVYNADQATKGGADDQLPANDVVDDASANGAQGSLGDTGGIGGAGDDGLGPVADNSPIDLNAMGDDEGEDGADLGADPLAQQDDPGVDGDGVESFEEPAAEDGSGSILDRVLNMLKAQADADKAKAEAEAERYRAQQTEYSARAASAASRDQEELAQMELAMDRQKEEGKQAKKLADIAKFRVSQAGGLREGEEGETVAMVRRQMAQLPMKWEILPTDDVKTRNYKNTQKANQMRELQARMRTARTREIRAAELRDQGRNADPNANNPQQQQNGQQQNGQQQQNNPQANGQQQQGAGV